MILNRIIFVMPRVCPPRLHLLQGEVVAGTRRRHVRMIGRSPFCSPGLPALRWKSKLCSLGIICNVMLFIFEIKYIIILPYSRTSYLCESAARFRWLTGARRGPINRSLSHDIHIDLMYLTYSASLLFLYDSTFSTSSRVMVDTNWELNGENVIVRKCETI
jgi:hypothetical protein